MKHSYLTARKLKTPAPVVAQELEHIYSRDGGIQPQAVVEAARPETSPLHPEFEWDDSIAAEAYRCDQARNVIRAVILAPEIERNERFQPVRAFVTVYDESTGRVYKPLLAVAADANERNQVLSRLRNELLGIQRRYADTLVALGMMAALEDFQERLAS